MIIVCIATSQVPSATANSIQVMKVCQALAQLGHSVHLLVPSEHLSVSSEHLSVSGREQVSWEQLAAHYGLQSHGLQASFKVEWLQARPPLRRYDFSLAAVRRARALKADVVYVWPLQAAVMALVWGRPLLLELHGEPEGSFGPWLFRLCLRLRPATRLGVQRSKRFRRTKRFLPITQALASYLERVYGYQFSPGEVVISPNGVDLERFRDLPAPTEARRILGLPEGLTVGYTGHLYPGRGMGVLLELARHFQRVHFLWVGGRPEDVEAWRVKLETEGVSNIALLGFVENEKLPLYQAAAEILLMPYERIITGSSGGNSADYCSPMKMFEYMASGRAILASDLAVIHEVLNEQNALLCPPEDVQAWIQGLEMLISDSSQREALSRAAFQDVQHLTWQAREQRALDGF